MDRIREEVVQMPPSLGYCWRTANRNLLCHELLDEFLERKPITLFESGAPCLAVIGQNNKMVWPGRLSKSVLQAVKLLVELSQDIESTGIEDSRVWRDRCRLFSGQLGTTPSGKNIPEQRVDIQLAHQDCHHSP